MLQKTQKPTGQVGFLLIVSRILMWRECDAISWSETGRSLVWRGGNMLKPFRVFHRAVLPLAAWQSAGEA